MRRGNEEVEQNRNFALGPRAGAAGRDQHCRQDPGFSWQTVYRIQGDPVGAEAALAIWGSLIRGEVISLLFANPEYQMPMKYVMLRLDSGDLLPLIFPQFMQHSHIASSVPATVVSAGHVYLENGQIVARGSSSSLGVSSREEDSEVIQGYMDGVNVIQREQPL